MASSEKQSIEASILSKENKDDVDVKETRSLTESEHEIVKPEDIPKDDSWQEIIQQKKITQATQGIEITASHEAAFKSKSTEDKGKNYSSFTTWEKRFIVFTATIAATFSPFTAQIYFPALNTIAKDLHVTNAKVNLTITTYMVCFSPTNFPIISFTKYGH